MRKVMLALFLQFSIIVSASAGDDLLISAEEAIKLINKPGVVFVSGDSKTAFAQGHIRGNSVEMYAHHLHHSDLTGEMECSPLFMCPEEAEEYIGSHGIDNDTLVLAYDNFRGPNATGVLAFFKSFGHEKIKMIDGGRAAVMKLDPNQAKYDKLKKEIIEAKKAKEDKDVIGKMQKELDLIEETLLVQKGKGKKLPKKEYHIDEEKIDYSWITGKEEVLKAAMDISEKGEDSRYRIIDSRGMIEVIGERKMDNVARGGHIPGSKFLEWSNITDFENELSFRDKEYMREFFKKNGITKDKTIYAYCHVGAGRSSHIITALKMLGYDNVKVYTGSWDEWGNDLNLPISR